MKTKHFLLALLLVFFCQAGPALSLDSSFSREKNYRLEGLWKFKPGSEKIWNTPGFDDQSWKRIQVPGYWDDQGFRGLKGEAWYRTRFTLRMPPYERPIGLYLGDILDTDEVFLNGKSIGRTDRPMFGKLRLYPIPPNLLRFRGENVLAVRIWHAPLPYSVVGGFAKSGIALGDFESFKDKMFLGDLWQLAISALILFVGLFHLPFYLKRKRAREYLFFFLLCLCMGVYGLARSQLRFRFPEGLFLWQHLQYLSCFPAAVLALEYVLSLFERKRPFFVGLLESLALSITAIALVSHSLYVDSALLVPFYLVTIGLVTYLLRILLAEASIGKREARLLWLAIGILALASLNDAMVTLRIYRLGIDWLNSIDLTASSFLLVIACMTFSLSTNFLRTHEVLEGEISERKQVEKALRESETKLRAIIENTPELIFIKDLAGRYLLINDAVAEFLCLPKARILGKTDRELCCPIPGGRGSNAKALEPGTIQPFEMDFFRKDGSKRTFQGNTFPFLSSEGQTIGLIGICRDITDRKTAEEEKVRLKEAMIETLKETDMLKDQFLSILSHELRTPINSITGYASILEDEVAGSLGEVQHQYLQKILTGADNLMSLVEDLLDISRVQAGKFTVTPRWTDFREVALNVIENLTPLATRRQLILLDEVPADLPPVLADARRIGQVLSNLVNNAIKFTPADGKISVRAFLEGATLRCEVKDMGIGITREDIPRLFKRFSQLDMSSTRKAGGTGLGLSIANAIIEAHGGKIGVESEVGKGSAFWFSIPTVPSIR
ncbi:MAG TPA: hypothetical protein DD435_10300 [Cyanobacteria bacterium UBA8530]|nr:hypothetical protein [Cyanobacteria bacterium UBA8530]